MLSHLAVGVDGSPGAQAAVDLTLDVAARMEAVVHGLHVIDSALMEGSWITDLTGAVGVEPLVHLTPQMETMLSDVAESVKEVFVDAASARGVRSDFQILRGAVPHTLVDASGACSLLVVGKRGVNARYHGDLLGPTTERLLRLAAIPIVVAPPEVERPTKILLGYDGSAKAKGAMRFAGNLAEKMELPVTVLSVSRDPDVARQRLEQAAEHFAPLGIEVTTRAAEGHPEEEIGAVADELGAGTVVCVGSHGHGRIVELVLGSTTEFLARSLPCPVVCVP